MAFFEIPLAHAKTFFLVIPCRCVIAHILTIHSSTGGVDLSQLSYSKCQHTAPAHQVFTRDPENGTRFFYENKQRSKSYTILNLVPVELAFEPFKVTFDPTLVAILSTLRSTEFQPQFVPIEKSRCHLPGSRVSWGMASTVTVMLLSSGTRSRFTSFEA